MLARRRLSIRRYSRWALLRHYHKDFESCYPLKRGPLPGKRPSWLIKGQLSCHPQQHLRLSGSGFEEPARSQRVADPLFRRYALSRRKDVLVVSHRTTRRRSKCADPGWNPWCTCAWAKGQIRATRIHPKRVRVVDCAETCIVAEEDAISLSIRERQSEMAWTQT